MNDSGHSIDELVRELAQKATEVRVLQEVSSRINATLDLEEILTIVLSTMDELFAFDHALLLLLDPDGASLTVAASRGYEGKGVGNKAKLGVGVIGVVAKRRRMMRVNNLGQQRTYAAAVRKRMAEVGKDHELDPVADLPGLPNAECQIAIPLMIKDDLIGVFSVESAEQKIFGERDEVLATIVANQAAAAIHNARLYQSEALRRQELAVAHDDLRRLAENLEDRVRERTAELEKTNYELREAQAQLVQQEKMASLGKLVAGVAHELNTPIGSIRANADLALRALAKVKGGLAAQSGDARLTRAIDALEKACETELLASERAVDIVRSLRNFARLDEADEKLADLHEGIDSTVTVLAHELGSAVTIDKRYGELPQLWCHPNQLNQVFMNLLVNARQAIDPPGTITIQTSVEGGDIVIAITDTGSGIDTEHLGRIFDPGFTTKGVGVGMGLGLAICHQIVRRHNGRIEVTSTAGRGSTFTVRLPLTR